MTTASSPLLAYYDGWVLLVLTLSTFMLSWMTITVGGQRRKAGIKYPKMYDEKAHVFNCYQRGHQNTLEAFPIFLVGMLIAGHAFPRLAAALGGGWILFRVWYFLGYATGEPNNRMYGFLGSVVCQVALGLVSLATALMQLGLFSW